MEALFESVIFLQTVRKIPSLLLPACWNLGLLDKLDCCKAENRELFFTPCVIFITKSELEKEEKGKKEKK